MEMYTTHETHLEQLSECFQSIPWVPTLHESNRHEQSPPFPPIAAMSAFFQLNFWQHVIIETGSRHLLYSHLCDIQQEVHCAFPIPPSSGPYNLKPKMIAYLGGEAERGRSRVIHEILHFTRGWNRPRTVETMILIGVAAINIDGKTIRSARNLSVSQRQTNSPTMKMKQ